MRLMSRSATIAATLPRPAAEELRKVGMALRAARLARNEPQTVLARRLGIAPRTVRAAERGNPRVGSGVLVSMLWALGLGPVGDDLVSQATKSALATGKVRARRSSRSPGALDDF
ncbi:MAG: hypothetical protein ACT4P5_23030 [Armatimonadota bacterium]